MPENSTLCRQGIQVRGVSAIQPLRRQLIAQNKEEIGTGHCVWGTERGESAVILHENSGLLNHQVPDYQVSFRGFVD